MFGVYLVNFSLLVVFIFIYFLNACLCFAIDLSFWKNIEVLVSFSPFAPLSVLTSLRPGQLWDHLCPGIWDHLCPGIWDHLCPRIRDHLCPGIWDHLCPAFMNLRVNSRCQSKIVCVHLTSFFAIKGQSVPSPGLGTICAQHLWSCMLI